MGALDIHRRSCARSHFTDPDYGITVSEKLGRVALVLKYVAETGDIKRVAPTWSFFTPGGKDTALQAARRERDKLLEQPQFQAYLRQTYADPTGRRSRHVRSENGNHRGLIPNLQGLFVSVTTKHSRVLGGSVNYVNIYAHGPGANAKTKYRSWSVRKYGLNQALDKAASWRAEYVGSQKPSAMEMAKAEAAVRATFRAYLSGEG